MDDINDLEWLAFAYVADELPAADRKAFETRLASDQSAREAVAAAVELAQGVSAAFALPAPQRRWSKALRPLGWSCFGAAAALLVAVSLRFAGNGNAKPDSSSTGLASVDQQVLTSTWAEVRGAARDADAETVDEWLAGVEIDEPAAPAEERSSPPGWLVLATSAGAARSEQ